MAGRSKSVPLGVIAGQGLPLVLQFHASTIDALAQWYSAPEVVDETPLPSPASMPTILPIPVQRRWEFEDLSMEMRARVLASITERHQTLNDIKVIDRHRVWMP